MDFALNELQEQVRELAREILADGCTPERLRAVEATDQRIDESLWQTLIESGLAAVASSEEAGGGGLSLLEFGLILEQVGATAAPVPLLGHGLAALATERGLSPGALAPLLAQSGWMACSTRTEGNALSFVDGQLSGELGGIAYGMGSHHLVVPARDGDDWCVCLLVNAAETVNWQPQASTALEPWGLLQARNAAAQKLGGSDLLSWVVQLETMGLAMAQTGVLDAALQLARNHVCEREQFGVLIGSFQAVSQRLADCWIDLMNLRLAAIAAVTRLASGADAQLDVLTARIWTAEAGHRVLASCQHVHGGLGHDRDYPLWRHAVWARHYEMVAGGVNLALEELGKVIARDPEASCL
jgi:3-oxocholest-4-en-26-oyl-CoA dehydrogenase beta subunit